MKKVILMLMLLAPMALFAQKFGHIDTQSIIQSLPEFARANGEIEAVGKQYENELKASQDELQRMAEEYDKNKSTMNETKQRETEEQLNQMYTRIQQQAQQNQQAFQKTQAEKLQPIFDKVRKAIASVPPLPPSAKAIRTWFGLLYKATACTDSTSVGILCHTLPHRHRPS